MGEVRWGCSAWLTIYLYNSPLPLIPSHEGRGKLILTLKAAIGMKHIKTLSLGLFPIATQPSAMFLAGTRRQMFEEAKGRRVFDAAAKSLGAKEIPLKAGSSCRVDFFGSFFTIKERTL
jgi:hypothetical protein